MRFIALTTVCAACFGAGLASAEGRPKTILSVCEVLNNLDAHDGKMIAIRGEWVVGPEQNELRGDGCPGELRQSVQPCENAIWLTPPGLSATQKRVSFKVDLKSFEDVRTALRKKSTGHKVISRQVTFVGQLETKPLSSLILRSTVRSNDGVVCVGFGHTNIYPAQLIYESVSDPAVITATQ